MMIAVRPAGVLALAALLGLAACAGTRPGTPTPPRGSPGLMLAPEALLVTGTGQEIGFGRAPDNAIAAVSARTGAAPVSDIQRSDCPAGALREVRYPDGLSLWFRERMLVGWSVAGAPAGRYATPAGLTTGLGREAALALPGTASTPAGLQAGGITARLEPDGTVARLEAGRTCG